MRLRKDNVGGRQIAKYSINGKNVLILELNEEGCEKVLRDLVGRIFKGKNS